jgi:uncharacterized protein (DUF427 family)
MTDSKSQIPDANHRIMVEQSRSTVVVRRGPAQIGKTSSALTLSEASHPPVQYIPRVDVDMSQLERSTHTIYCPYQGKANYYSIPPSGGTGLNAVWTYEAPFEAVGSIAGHLAFYPDQVSVENGD